MPIQPLLFDGFPFGAGEALEDVVDDIGGGNGPVEVTHDMPVDHLRLPKRSALYALATGLEQRLCQLAITQLGWGLAGCFG